MRISVSLKSLLAVLVATVAYSVHAADAATETPSARVAFVLKNSATLNLTNAQRKSIDLAIKTADEQARPKGADIDSIWSDEADKIEAVLSPEQLAKLKALRGKQ